jgi:hypothetical protein
LKILLVAALAVALAPTAHAATTTSVPNPVTTTTPLAQAKPRTTTNQAIRLFLADDKVADWLDRYPAKRRSTSASFEPEITKCGFGARGGCWDVSVFDTKAGEVAKGKVDDVTKVVTEAWTGPQVAWTMARGGNGAFGGRRINSLRYWLPLCALFFLGLADLRRPFSLRNLDLLVLLSLSVSLWFFNHGNVFASAPLAYPPLAYLLGRCVWIGVRGRPSRGAPTWPAWALIGLAVFVGGFKIGLDYRGGSNVIDVGYAGVIGAQRIAAGVVPYGNFPDEDDLKACGPADANGEIRDRIQHNGRCESANPLGDTYGPVAYEAYLPGYGIFGWSGKWDKLPAVKFTSVLFDFLCLLGMALVGLRFGGPPFAGALALAWSAFPFTTYVLMSNTNDSIVPVFLIWGFVFASSAWSRGVAVALSGWTKFGALVVAPLWLTYPGPVRRPRPAAAFAAGFVIASVAAFSILLLDAHPIQAAETFYHRTIKTQVTRDSPFSLWDWAQYHARGLPDLHVVQWVLEGLLVLGALAAAVVPSRKNPLQLAALSGALLIGFQLVLTHWFYLYIPWFFPFVAVAVIAGGRQATV